MGNGQKPGALALGRHGARGTAKVQIDPTVAHLPQSAGGADKILRPPGQQLGNQINALVLLRRNLRQLLFVENPALPRR